MQINDEPSAGEVRFDETTYLSGGLHTGDRRAEYSGQPQP